MQLPKRNWTDKVYQFLISQGSQSGVVAFDFDNTLVKNDFGEAVMENILYSGMPKFTGDFTSYFSDKERAKISWEKKNHSLSDFRDYVIAEYEKIIENEGLENGYRWTSFIFSGYTETELREVARAVWKNEKRIKPYQEMLDLIQFLHHYKNTIYIVTASPTPIIQEVANEFSIEEKKILGMNAVKKNSVYCPEIIEPYTYGQGKVRAIQKVEDREISISFGDSINDLQLLNYSKQGIFIDRGYHEIRNTFKESGALIQPVFR